MAPERDMDEPVNIEMPYEDALRVLLGVEPDDDEDASDEGDE